LLGHFHPQGLPEAPTAGFLSPRMSESSFEVKGAQYRAVKTQYVRWHSSIEMTLDELISDLQTVRNQSRAP